MSMKLQIQFPDMGWPLLPLAKITSILSLTDPDDLKGKGRE